jgi:hypothetical protein
MQVGDGQQIVFAEIDRAAGVEDDAEEEFQRLKNWGACFEHSMEGN